MPSNLIYAMCFLCGFTDVKLANIQMIELLVIFMIVLRALSGDVLALFSSTQPIRYMAVNFIWMIFFIAAGSLLSLRLNFYPPGDFGILKSPPYATFVRLIEVIIAVFTLFLVTDFIGTSRERLIALFKCYVYCGVLNGIWSIFCWIVWFAGIAELPGVYSLGTSNGRMRGFFVEGGPLGVFLVGCILILAVSYYYLKAVERRSFYVQMGVLLVTLMGSQSKASIFMLFALTAVFIYVRRQFRLLFAISLLAVPLALSSDFVQGLQGYYANYERFSQAAYERSDDRNLVMGRMMASVLLPRIVEREPILGVGIGNYSLVRNDPDILRGLPFTDDWDLHGLGLLGYLAELGVPLTIFVLYIYLIPVILARGTREWITILSTYPLFAALFGVQLNFAYPWIVAGFGLSCVAIYKERHSLPVYERKVAM